MSNHNKTGYLDQPATSMVDMNHPSGVCVCAIQVWEMSNQNKAGYLDKLAFHRAMDIVSLAQMVGVSTASLSEGTS